MIGVAGIPPTLTSCSRSGLTKPGTAILVVRPAIAAMERQARFWRRQSLAAAAPATFPSTAWAAPAPAAALPNQDRVSISLQQPLRIKRGRTSLVLPVTRTTRTRVGQVRHTTVDAALALDERQIDLAVNQEQASAGDPLRLGFIWSHDSRHDAAAPIRASRFWPAGGGRYGPTHRPTDGPCMNLPCAEGTERVVPEDVAAGEMILPLGCQRYGRDRAVD